MLILLSVWLSLIHICSKSGSSEEQTAADSSDSGSDATGNSTDEETETGSGD